MSSIVTSILSSTIGLLWNKARDKTAEKLQDGDVTDENIRKIVVRELNDIKTKLDGLVRKDLRSSCSFLEEGVDFLYVALGKSNLGFEPKALANETQDDRAKTSSMTSGAQCQMLNEVLELSHLMGKLKVNAEKEIKEAEDRFKDARKKATEAFSNEALSIKDTILAAALRIVSQILERLDSPEIAITGCLSVLKKLHSSPAIQEIFNVYINGGVWSLMNKAERVNNVKSVMLINHVLFKYVSKFGSKSPSMLAWPTIDFADRSFNPILSWHELSTRKSMGDELTKHPSGLNFARRLFVWVVVAITGYGEIVVAHSFTSSVEVISKTGEWEMVILPETYTECEIVQQRIQAGAVDKNNNVYIVRWLKIRTVNGDEERSCVLYILDENYDVKQEYNLDFLEAKDENDHVKIAINKNNDIIMRKERAPDVFVCDNKGNLKHKFKQESNWLRSLSISNKNEIMVSSKDCRAVHIYSEEGNLKSTINLPEGHWLCGMAYHFAFSKIIVSTYVKTKDSSFLLCYTEEGKLETTTYFGNKYEFPHITSHPSSSFAVVTQERIIFI